MYEKTEPFDNINIVFLKGQKGDTAYPDDKTVSTALNKYLNEHGSELINPQLITDAINAYIEEHEGIELTNASLGQGYGVCSETSTYDASPAMIVEMDNYVKSPGGIVSIYFEDVDVPAESYMNINGQGFHSIYYDNNLIANNVITRGDLASFVFTGTQYHLISIDSGVGFLVGHEETEVTTSVTYEENDDLASKDVQLPVHRLYFSNGEHIDLLTKESLEVANDYFVLLDSNGMIPSSNLPLATLDSPGIAKLPEYTSEISYRIESSVAPGEIDRNVYEIKKEGYYPLIISGYNINEMIDDESQESIWEYDIHVIGNYLNTVDSISGIANGEFILSCISGPSARVKYSVDISVLWLRVM